METYLYTATEIITQKRVKGQLEGESEEKIRQALIDKNLYPKTIKRKNAFNSDLALFKQRVTLRDITFFCKQFAAMIQAGISIAKSLEICAGQSNNKTLKMHLENIHEAVSEGKTLSEAAEDEKVFPDILVNLIACGEASGNLDEVMNRSVEHFDNQLGIIKKVKKALTYPVIVLCIVAVVVVILMVKVVPSFLGLLNDTGADIPVPTQMVIAVSNFFVQQWGVLLVLVGVLVFVVVNIKKLPQVEKSLDYLSLRLPIFGDLYKKNLSASFSSTLAMLVESGLPMLQAMEITKKVMGNKVAEEEMNQAIEALKQGSSLLGAISGSTIFPPILMSMVNVGEESGALDEMLLKISVYFKEEVEVAVDNLTMLIEPILILVVAVIIGGIMLAIMLPTFSAATAAM